MMGKEPELVSEVERSGLDIVSLTLAHGSGTSLLESGWTLELPMVRGGGQGWQWLLPLGSVTVLWSKPL